MGDSKNSKPVSVAKLIFSLGGSVRSGRRDALLVPLPGKVDGCMPA